MGWLPLLIILLPAVLYAAWEERRRARRLRRFWERPNTTVCWTREFPGSTEADIREFLKLLNDAFAFSRKHTFCFLPQDTLNEIYRTVYPKLGGGDQCETECFYLLLKRRYGVSPEPVWQPTLSLGELFQHMRAPADGAG
jgi:hypothetical protein